MGVPALSTIQASMIACAILILCRNELASKFVFPFIARNHSVMLGAWTEMLEALTQDLDGSARQHIRYRHFPYLQGLYKLDV